MSWRGVLCRAPKLVPRAAALECERHFLGPNDGKFTFKNTRRLGIEPRSRRLCVFVSLCLRGS